MHSPKLIFSSFLFRNEDSGYFCRAAIDLSGAADFPVWIISDCRRPTDIEFFERHRAYHCLKVRVSASDETRMQRGWNWQEGVDDAPSECGLDKLENDIVIQNEGEEEADTLLQPLIDNLLAIVSVKNC